MQDIPVRFVAFDLLYIDGELLLDAPLQERRDRMARLLEGLLVAEEQQDGGLKIAPTKVGMAEARRGSTGGD